MFALARQVHDIENGLFIIIDLRGFVDHRPGQVVDLFLYRSFRDGISQFIHWSFEGLEDPPGRLARIRDTESHRREAENHNSKAPIASE